MDFPSILLVLEATVSAFASRGFCPAEWTHS